MHFKSRCYLAQIHKNKIFQNETYFSPTSSFPHSAVPASWRTGVGRIKGEIIIVFPCEKKQLHKLVFKGLLLHITNVQYHFNTFTCVKGVFLSYLKWTWFMTKLNGFCRWKMFFVVSFARKFFHVCLADKACTL